MSVNSYPGGLDEAPVSLAAIARCTEPRADEGCGAGERAGPAPGARSPEIAHAGSEHVEVPRPPEPAPVEAYEAQHAVADQPPAPWVVPSASPREPDAPPRGCGTPPVAPTTEPSEPGAEPAVGSAVGPESASGSAVVPAVACPRSWGSLLRPARPRGLRGLAHRVSGGLIAHESRRDRRRRVLLAAARTPVRGHVRIAVISIKGGVGKTTTTAALGAKLADLRGDRVVAVDANPHRGTLADRVGRTCQATVRDVLRAPERLTRYPDVQALTSQAPSRLEVLASEVDPGVASTFDDADYRSVAGVLERFYTICLTDCGTGLTEPVVAGVLGLADALIVPAMASLDAANLAHATLDWLDAQGYAHLVRSAVVVICGVRGRGQVIDLDQLEDTLRHRVRDVVRIPFDPHLHSGAVTDLNELRPATDEAYLRLAATIAGGFTPPESMPPGEQRLPR